LPTVRFPALLAAVHRAALRSASDVPSTIFFAGTTFFRTFDQKYFVADAHRRILRRDHANNALRIPRDSDKNRFTGASHNASIDPVGGLYCSLQQQALVNEAAFYREAGRAERAARAGMPLPKAIPRSAVLSDRAAIKLRNLGPVIAAELSPHNVEAVRFVNGIGNDAGVQTAMKSSGRGAKTMWEELNDADDCSVARGFGLALAKFGYQALCSQTVRESERSALERGDNVVFFGIEGRLVDNLSVVEAYLFPVVGELQVYPVEY
jgi:hypothetical protein